MKRLAAWGIVLLSLTVVLTGCPFFNGVFGGEGLPDLEFVTVDFSTDAATGEVTGVEFTFSNVGEDDVVDATYHIVLSTNAVIGSDDLLVYDSAISVNAGGQKTESLTDEIQTYISDNNVEVSEAEYYVGVRLDPDNDIEESNETNNNGSSGSTAFISGVAAGDQMVFDFTNNSSDTVNSNNPIYVGVFAKEDNNSDGDIGDFVTLIRFDGEGSNGISEADLVDTASDGIYWALVLYDAGDDMDPNIFAGVDNMAAFSEGAPGNLRGYHFNIVESDFTQVDFGSSYNFAWDPPTYSEDSLEPNDTYTEAEYLGSVGTGGYYFGDLTLSPAGDEDWFEVYLTNGQSIYIETGYADGSSASTDTDMAVYDGTGEFIEYGTDDATDLFAAHSFTAGYEGTFYIQVLGFSSTDTGPYSFSVSQQ